MRYLYPLAFLLFLIGLANASVNMSYDSTSKMWNITNSYRSYYINATNAIQYTNHPSVYWSQNAWCFNNSITGFRCADTESGFTWTNRTDNSTYALLVGTKTYTFTGGRTLKVTINYYLNDTNDWIQVVPNLNGNFNFVGTLTWRTHNIQIGGWKYWDWARVWLTNGTNDYPLNTTTNKSFPASMIATKSYYLYDSNTSEYAQTWWDRNLGLNIVKGTEFNDYMDLYNNISMSGTWQTNFTLWWVDAAPCTGILAYMDTPTTNLVKYLGDNFTMTGHWIQDVPNLYCASTASVTAQYQNSSGSWKAMNATTNLSTTSTNPITRSDGVFYQTATYVIRAGLTDNDILGNYSIRILINNNGYTFLSGSRLVNVTSNATCEIISASTTFSANHTRCQNITADNVVVDCYGFGVSPELSSLPYAKYAFYADNVKGITIKNCKINGTNTGIYLNRVNFSAVYNNTMTNIYKFATGFTAYGLEITNSRNNVFENNTIYNTSSCCGGLYPSSGTGIYLDKSNNSQFYNNTVSVVNDYDGETAGTGAGIYLFSYDYNNSFLSNYVNGTSSHGLYFGSTIFNSTFKNNRYHNSTGYGVYLGSIYNLTMENEDIRGATTSSIGFSPQGVGYPSDANSFKNISIQNATYCMYARYATNLYFQNFSISNCTTAIDFSRATNNVLGNSSIAQSTTHYVGDEYDVPPEIGINNTLFNVSGFDRTKISMGGNSNVTVKWYARVSVKDSAGSALVSTINVSSNLSQPVYFGYQSVSPYFIANDTLFGSGAMTWNNHSIVVNLSGYTTNLTYFNISYRDATINVTLYLAVTSSCTYSGSGNWIIQTADLCNITSSQYIYPNNLTFNGSIGYTSLGSLDNSLVVLVANRFKFNISGNALIFGYRSFTWFNGTIGG